ncbi:MAG: SLBB domain-containing protein [Chlorobiales bacterium]
MIGFNSKAKLRQLRMIAATFFVILFGEVLFAQEIALPSSGGIPATPSLPSNLMFGNPSRTTASANANQLPLPNAIPKNYIVGAGDVLLIAIFSQTYTTYQLPVTPSGTLIIPRLKEIPVQGLSIDKVQALLSREFAKVYRAADVTVSLISLRNFYVDIVGEVSVPTRLLVNAATRVSDVISQSPILQKASLRQVRLKRFNPDTMMTLDVFRYYRLLDNSDNPYLQENDVIQVSKQTKSVTIYGEVKYPDSYEFVEGDSLYTLLKLAGGLLESAILDSVDVIRYFPDQLHTYTFSVNVRGFPVSSNVPLQDGDRIQVRRIPLWRPDETVLVQGRVKVPGYYRIEKGKTRLRDIIERAGGFLELASLEEATLIRPKAIRKEIDLKTIKQIDLDDPEYQYAIARQREDPKGKITVDFKKLFLQNDDSQNIILEEGDIIDIPLFRNYVNVIGRVVRPGNINYAKGEGVEYYIQKAGGFTERAIKNDIKILKPNSGDLLDIDDIEEIEPSDVILIQEKPKSQFWTRSWEIFRDSIVVAGSIATTILLIRNVVQ